MPKLDELTINIGVRLSDETVNRCLQLLQMYLDDNPDKTITVHTSRSAETGAIERYVFIDEVNDEQP